VTLENSLWEYKTGPSDAMKQEIGQIVVNHALCDRGLYSLFVALSGLPEEQCSLVAKTLRLKASALLDLVIAFRKARALEIDAKFLPRIDDCIANYRKLSNARNIVAHWQWGPSPDGEDTAEVFNFLSMNHLDSNGSQTFTLLALKSISLGLVEVNTLLITLASLSDPAIPEFVKDTALKTLEFIHGKVRKALLNIPELPAEELP
jgi:hypothetical protein